MCQLLYKKLDQTDKEKNKTNIFNTDPDPKKAVYKRFCVNNLKGKVSEAFLIEDTGHQNAAFRFCVSQSAKVIMCAACEKDTLAFGTFYIKPLF